MLLAHYTNSKLTYRRCLSWSFKWNHLPLALYLFNCCKNAVGYNMDLWIQVTYREQHSWATLPTSLWFAECLQLCSPAQPSRTALCSTQQWGSIRDPSQCLAQEAPFRNAALPRIGWGTLTLALGRSSSKCLCSVYSPGILVALAAAQTPKKAFFSS